MIGKSVLGQNIFALCKQNNPCFKWALVTAGMHAREHLSCDVVCHLFKQLESQKANCNFCFVPLVNPDGANLCTLGANWLQAKDRRKLIEINGSDDFSLFKANANGVDLNNNWDARWQTKFSNKTSPSSQGFYGNAPMSQPEVQALAALTNKLNLFLSVSFHLKGEEIYFDFFQEGKRLERDAKIAQVFAKSTGYAIKPTQEVSSGGFKDWCVEKLKIPALTIELGNDQFSHPFPKQQLSVMLRQNSQFFENVQKSLKIFEKFAPSLAKE